MTNEGHDDLYKLVRVGLTSKPRHTGADFVDDDA